MVRVQNDLIPSARLLCYVNGQFRFWFIDCFYQQLIFVLHDNLIPSHDCLNPIGINRRCAKKWKTGNCLCPWAHMLNVNDALWVNDGFTSCVAFDHKAHRRNKTKVIEYIWGIVSKFLDCAYWTKTTERISLKFIFSERIIQGLQTGNEFWNCFGWLWCGSDECGHTKVLLFTHSFWANYPWYCIVLKDYFTIYCLSQDMTTFVHHPERDAKYLTTKRDFESPITGKML